MSDAARSKPTYIAIAERSESGWTVRIPGLGNNPEEGLPTQARTADDVKPMVRDLIATYLEIPDDSFEIEVQWPTT